MSKTIDERVVEMRFDNSRFQKNVQDTIDQLEQLKKSLKFEETSDGLDSFVSKLGNIKSKVTSGFKGIFNGVTSAISNIKNHLTSGSSGIFSGFSNLISNLKNKLSFGRNSGLDNLSNQAGQASVAIEGMGSALDSVKVKFSALQVVGATILGNLTNKVVNFATRGISGIFNKIETGGWNRASQLENARFSMQGILKDTSKVEEVLKNAADSVDGTAYALNSAANAASQFAASGVKGGDEMTRALKGVAGVAATTNSDYDSLAHIFTTVAGNGKLMTMQLNQLSLRGMNAAASLTEYFNGVNKGSIAASDAVKKSIKDITKGKQITEGELRDLVQKGKISFSVFSEAMATTFGDHAKDANKTFTGAMANIRAALSRTGQMFFTGYGMVDKFGKAFKGIVDEDSGVVKMFNEIRIAINRFNKALMGQDESGKALEGFVNVGVAFQEQVLKMAEYIGRFFHYLRGDWFRMLIDGFLNLLTPIKQVKEVFGEFMHEMLPADKRGKNIWHYLWWGGYYFKQFSTNVRLSSKSVSLFKSIFSTVGTIFKNIVGSVKNFYEALNTNTGNYLFFTNMQKAVEGLLAVVHMAGTVLSWFFELLKPVATLMGALFGVVVDSSSAATGAIGGTLVQMDKWMSSITVFTDIANRLTEWVQKIIPYIENFRKKIFNVSQTMRTFTEATSFVDMLKKLLDVIKNIPTYFKRAYDWIKNFIGEVKKCPDGITGVIKGFQGLPKPLQYVVDNFDKIVDASHKAKDAMTGVFKDALSSYRKNGQGLSGISGMMFDGLAGALRGVSTLIKRFIGKDFTGIVNSAIVPKIQNARDTVVNFIDSLTAKYPKLKAVNDGIKNFADKVVGWVKALKGSKDGWKSVTPSKTIQPFIQGSEKAEKAAGILDKIWVTIKNFGAKIAPAVKTAFGKLREGFDWFKGYIPTIKKSISNFISALKERELISKTKSVFSKLADIIKKSATNLKNAWTKIHSAVSSGWNKFKDVFGKLHDFMARVTTGLKNTFTTVKNTISNAFSGVDFNKPVDVIKGFFTTIKELFGKAFEWVKEKLSGDSESPFKNFLDKMQPITDTLSRLGEGLKTAFQTIFGSVETSVGGANTGRILNNFSSAFSTFAKVLSPIVKFVQTLADNFAPSLKKFGGKMQSAIDNLNIDQISGLIKSGALFLISDGIFRYLKTFAKIKKVASDAEGIEKFFPKITKSIKGFFDTFKEKLKFANIFTFASAIAIVAASILMIGNMDPDAAVQGMMGVLTLAGVLYMIAKKLDKVAESKNDISKFGSMMAKFGIGMWVMAKAVGALGELDAGTIMIGVAALAAISHIISTLAVTISQGANAEVIQGIAKAVKTLSVSLLIIAGALGALSLFDQNKVRAAATSLAGMFLAVTLMVPILSSMKGITNAKTVVGMIAGVLLSTAALIPIFSTFAKLSASQIAAGTAAIVLALGSIAAIVILMNKFVRTRTPKKLGALVAVIDGIMLGVNALIPFFNTIGNLPWSSKGKSGVVGGLVAMITSLGAVLGAMFLLLKIKGGRTYKGMLELAGVIDAVMVAVLAITPFFETVGNLAWVSKAKSGVLGGLVAMIGSLGAVVGAIFLLNKFVKVKNEDQLLKLGAVFDMMAVALAMISDFFASVGNTSWGGIAKSLVAMAGSLLLLVGVVALLGTVGKVPGAIAAAILLTTAAAMWVMSHALEGLAKGVDAFIGPLRKLEDVKMGSIGKALALILGLAIASIPASVGFVILAAGVIVLGAALVVIAAAMLIFGAALGVIGAMIGAIAQGFIVFAGAITEVAAAAAGLASIDKFWSGLGRLVVLCLALIPAAIGVAVFAVALGVLGLALIPISVGVSAIAISVGLLVGAVAKAMSAFAKFVAALTVLSKLGKKTDFGFLTNMFESIGKALPNLARNLGSAISSFFDAIADEAYNIGQSLRNAGQEIMQPIVDLVNDFILAALTSLDEHMPEFTDKGASAAEKFMTGIGDHADGLVSTAYDMCMKFLTALDTYVPMFAEKGFDVIISMVNGISDAIDEKAPELHAAIERLKQSFHDGWDTIWHGTKEKGKEKGKEAPEGVKAGIEDGSNFDSETGGLKTSLINSLMTSLFGVKEESKAAEGGKTGGGILASLAEWASSDKFQGAMDTMVSAAMSALKISVANYAEEHAGLAGKLIAWKFRKGIEDKPEETGKSAKKHVDSAKASVEQGKKTLETAASGYKGAIASGVNKGSGNISGAIDSVVKPAKTKADNYKNNFQNVGRHWMEYCAKAVKAAGNVNVIPAVNSISKTAKTKANNYQNNFYNVGKHWMVGLKNGINDWGPKAIAAAQAVADRIAKITAKALQEKSPSRLSFKYGKFWTEGLANGIISLADRIAKVAKTVAERAINPLVDGIGSAVDYVSNSDANFQPVVAPVMDMTNVRQGAYDISNMLYAAQSAGLANGMSNEFNANSYEQMNAVMQVDNRDLLRSMSGLSNEVEDLKNVVRNLKVYMDTGALVGEIRDPIDKALGVKANRRARGG